MKSAITVATLACCLPVAAWIGSPPPSPTGTSAMVAAPREDKWFDGYVDGWMVEEDGTVLVRMQISGGKRSIWLRTPANQSSTTQFELLTLHAVMHLESTGPAAQQLVRLRGEATAQLDGEKPEDAMRLLAIGRL